jgi:hypothetical protein
MSEENHQQQLQQQNQNQQQNLEEEKETIFDLFTAFDKESQQNLKKFIEIFINSDAAEQKYIEEFDNLHYYLRDYECYLNAKINSQKEAISKFCSKIN